jgi:hypothetical protein
MLTTVERETLFFLFFRKQLRHLKVQICPRMSLKVIGQYALPAVLASPPGPGPSFGIGGRSAFVRDRRPTFSSAAHLLTLALPCDEALIAVPKSILKSLKESAAAGLESAGVNDLDRGNGIAELMLDLLMITSTTEETDGVATATTELNSWVQQAGFSQISGILLRHNGEILGVVVACWKKPIDFPSAYPFLAKVHSILHNFSIQQSEIIQLHLELTSEEDEKYEGRKCVKQS